MLLKSCGSFNLTIIQYTFISATPPNVYPPQIIPTNMIAFNHPFSEEVMCKSHADGRTNETTYDHKIIIDKHTELLNVVLVHN